MDFNQQKQVTEKQVQEKMLDRHLQKSSDNLNSDESLSCEIKERIRLINALMVQVFLDSKDVETHNLLPWIHRLVKSFKLYETCEFDVLIETYTIAIRETRKGYVIKNRPAWFKSTAFNIISNLSREMKKKDLVKNKLKHDQSETNNVEFCDESSDKTRCLIKAFKNLRQEDQQLLKLRVVEGLTWSDIAERMIAKGEENTISIETLARLRKRHERALKRLRSHYENSA